MNNYFIIAGKFLVLALIVFSSLSAAYGQNMAQLKKNAIHLIPGTALLASGVTLSYERRINQRSFLRTGIGKFTGANTEAEYIFVHYGILLGKNSNHFELSGGPLLLQSTSKSRSISLAAGYRYQKPNGKFIFRTGVSWPEFYYFSFGFAF